MLFLNSNIMQKNIILFFILFPLIVLSQNDNWGKLINGFNNSDVARCFYEDTINDKLLIGIDDEGVDTITNSKGIIIWNGNNWETMGTSIYYSGIISNIITYLDTIYISGYFDGIGGNPNIRNIAKWNGNEWVDIGFNTTEHIRGMRIFNNELFIFGGIDSINGIVANGLIKYNGVEWNNVNNLPQFDTSYNEANQIFEIAYFENELYVGGNFNNNDYSLRDIVKYNGSEWVDVGGSLKGSSAWVNKMVVYKNELIVGGWFHKYDGNAGNNIMKWDGNKWSELFSSDSIDLSSGQVMDLKVKDDELYISGAFGVNGYGEKILKWDGNNLCSFGGDFNNNVYSMGFFRDTLYIGCGTMIDSLEVNGIAKWIGGNDFDTCSVLQSVPQINNELNNLIIYPNPTNGEFNLKLNSEIPLETEITIFSINGSKLFEKQFYQTNEIKINNLHLEKGVYFVKIKTDKSIITKKLIIN